MFYHHYRFKPRMIPSLAVLVILPILLSLGFWQLGRMQEKQDMLDLLAQSNETALAFSKLGSEPLNYTNVKVSGKFLNEFSTLLEHQMHNGRAGYQVLTPVEITPDKPLLWVNRGWIAKNEPISNANAHEITGLLYYPGKKGFILGENLSLDENNTVHIQRVSVPDLEAHFQQDFYPYVLLLDPNNQDGFIRDWQIKTLPPSKHLGYAVQWFALAFTLLILYFIVNLQRKTKK